MIDEQSLKAFWNMITIWAWLDSQIIWDWILKGFSITQFLFFKNMTKACREYFESFHKSDLWPPWPMEVCLPFLINVSWGPWTAQKSVFLHTTSGTIGSKWSRLCSHPQRRPRTCKNTKTQSPHHLCANLYHATLALGMKTESLKSKNTRTSDVKSSN